MLRWAAGASLRASWELLPAALKDSPLGLAYGRMLHALVRRHARRNQGFGTCFFRNRPELELMRRLLENWPRGDALRIAVLGCSKGAEVYSISWFLRQARPDLRLTIRAVDISEEVLAFAKRGVYPRTNAAAAEVIKDWDSGEGGALPDSLLDYDPFILERLSAAELEAIFEFDADVARVKTEIRNGILWARGDAGDPETAARLGRQDIVTANRFLCHMAPEAAEKCLRNLSGFVAKGGYLFVSGADLDLRAKVARELGWKPVTELAREIHDGDPVMRRSWPLAYWGLEPFCGARRDWAIRYASVFQIS